MDDVSDVRDSDSQCIIERERGKDTVKVTDLPGSHCRSFPLFHIQIHCFFSPVKESYKVIEFKYQNYVT